ncbi:hypothetical protein HOH87_07705 [bacterium]|nr:hypothetical protein [bacterium]
MNKQISPFIVLMMIIGIFLLNPTATFAGFSKTNAKTALMAQSKQVISLRYTSNSKTPSFVKGKFAFSRFRTKQSVAKAFMGSTLPKALGLKNVRSRNFKQIRQIRDAHKQRTIVRLKQDYEGIPIFASDVAVHISDQNEVLLTSGQFHDIRLKTTRPKISGLDATNISNGLIGKSGKSDPATLEIYTINGSSQLVWHVVTKISDPVEEWHYLINAETGKRVIFYNNIQDTKHRKTHDANHGSSLPGTLILDEDQGTSTDNEINTAHDHMGTTYDYFKDTFDRDSYDDNGAILSTTVHYGSNYVNAYWNGSQLVFGDGSGNVGPLGNALDIVAHELGHAVTSRTGNMTYYSQPGALNESMSDFWGAMVDRDDWNMGEDAWSPNDPSIALRYFEDPTLGNQPAHMDNYYTGTGDNQGVHINSGILNKAAYLVATAITREKAETIYYRALTTYFTQSTNFLQARTALEQSAIDLYGDNSSELQAVTTAFEAVGIIPPPPPAGDFEGIYFSDPYSTPHPYTDNTTYTKTYTHPGAAAMKVVFTNTNVEANYDFIRIKNADGQTIYTYDGNLGDFTTGPVSGDTITVEFITDYSVTGYGFDITGYHADLSIGDMIDPVTDFSAISTGNVVDLTWTLPSSPILNNVELRRKTNADPDNHGTKVFEQLTSNFTDGPLIENTTYYYEIYAVTTAKDYSVITTLNVTTVNRPPAAPIMAIVETSTRNVSLSWTNPEDLDFRTVVIRRSTTHSPTSLTDGTHVSEVFGNIIIDHGLDPGTDYFYSIFAKDAGDLYSIPATASVTTLGIKIPVPESPESEPIEIGQIKLNGVDFTGQSNVISTLPKIEFDLNYPIDTAIDVTVRVRIMKESSQTQARAFMIQSTSPQKITLDLNENHGLEFSTTALNDALKPNTAYYLEIDVEDTTGIQLTFRTSAFQTAADILSVTNLLNGPNPFNPSAESTTIQFELAKQADISLYIYSLSGQRLWTKEISQANTIIGMNTIDWNGKDQSGQYAPNGMVVLYFIAKNETKTIKRKLKIGVLR